MERKEMQWYHVYNACFSFVKAESLYNSKAMHLANIVNYYFLLSINFMWEKCLSYV